MSTGNLNLDLLLNRIKLDAISDSIEGIEQISKRYPALCEKEASEIYALVIGASTSYDEIKASLVVTAPASFSIKAKSTKNTVESLIKDAQGSILITGYSLSDYFSELVDSIIRKSQEGVFVKFFVNNIENQASFDKVYRYKGRFLKIYNYPKQKDDAMSALHAKVISVDMNKTLITSANLSYHGQEGNIELGTYVQSKEIAQQLDDFFTHLIFRKVFVEV
jgi:phosphatidylserine/phosphatidylglycerophosphate/cardiolipin synthase-like enzyme